MKPFAVLLLSSLLLASCTKEDKPTPQPVSPSTPKACESRCASVDKKLCTTLFQEYDICDAAMSANDCQPFIDAFAKTLPRTVDCTNTCGNEAFKMPIAYSCDEIDQAGYPKITERASHLLAKLKFKAATKLLLSDEFHGILDGALAEDMIPLIKKAKIKEHK